MTTFLWYVLVTGLAAPLWVLAFMLFMHWWERRTDPLIQTVKCQVCGYHFTLQRPQTPYTCPDCVQDPERAARIAERVGLARARLQPGQSPLLDQPEPAERKA